MSDTSSSISGYIGTIYFFLVFYSVGIVVYYAEPGFPWHTYITLIIGYYCSFGILLLVPIDIAAVVVDRRSTSSQQTGDSTYSDNVHLLSTAYAVFFDIILIFGSFILVFEEYFNTDGYFTLIGKLWSSWKRMCIDMFAGVVAGLIILGILIGQKIVPANASALQLAAVIVTNTVYETFLVFLLAYGLVEFPRSIWNSSNYKYYLLLTQMKATYDYKEISDYKIDIQEDISKVNYFKEMILTGGSDDALKNALTVLQGDCPAEFKSSRKCKPEEVKKYLTKTGQVTIDGLARLRGDLNVNKDRYKMAQEKVKTTEKRAYFLEDLVAAQETGAATIRWSLKNADSSVNEYRWYIRFRPTILKIASVMFALVSFLSFLGVIGSMNGVPPNSLPYFVAVHSSSASTGGIALFILFTLGYTVYVSLWSLFQMRIAGISELVPFRTTPEGLSFNVRMCARLAAPLAFFYLGWISENGLDNGDWVYDLAPVNGTYSERIEMQSAFSNFYSLQKVGVIKSTFGTLFPVILFILLFLFITNFFNRLLVLIKMESYQFGTPFPTEEQLREGKRQLAKFKKIAERAEARNLLKSHILHVMKPVGGGFLSSIFGATEEERPSHSVNLDPVVRHGDEPTIKEPEVLSGVVEKKGGSTLGVGSKWSEMYAEVRSPGFLYFFKDKKAAAAAFAGKPDHAALQTASQAYADLRLILDFKAVFKKNKENSQLDLELAEETIKIRFKSPTEADRWKVLLVEWKDFAVDYGDMYPNGLGDVEGGRGSLSAASKPAPTASAPKGTNSKESSAAAQYNAALDSIVVEDDEEDTSSAGVRPLMKGKANSTTYNPFKPGSGGGAGGGLGKGGAPSTVAAASSSSSTDDLEGQKPAHIEGWLEKKGHGKLMSNDWQRRYCRIDDATCSFVYYKSQGVKEKPLGSLDLRQCNDIGAYEKGAGKLDTTRFNIDMGDKVYKFKAVSATEGERWAKALNEWKDYFLMHMH